MSCGTSCGIPVSMDPDKQLNLPFPRIQHLLAVVDGQILPLPTINTGQYESLKKVVTPFLWLPHQKATTSSLGSEFRGSSLTINSVATKLPEVRDAANRTPSKSCSSSQRSSSHLIDCYDCTTMVEFWVTRAISLNKNLFNRSFCKVCNPFLEIVLDAIRSLSSPSV